jgi:hypothetical protein
MTQSIAEVMSNTMTKELSGRAQYSDCDVAGVSG